MKKPNGLMGALNDNWKIILFVGAIVVGWTQMQSKINEVQADNISLASRVESLEKGYVQIQVSLSQIETTLKFIEQKL